MDCGFRVFAYSPLKRRNWRSRSLAKMRRRLVNCKNHDFSIEADKRVLSSQSLYVPIWDPETAAFLVSKVVVLFFRIEPNRTGP